MSNKDKIKREIENEIMRLKRKLDDIEDDEVDEFEDNRVRIINTEEDDEVKFVKPLPPLPPKPPTIPLPGIHLRHAPRIERNDHKLTDQERERIQQEKERIRQERERVTQEVRNLREDLYKKKRDIDKEREEFREKERRLREKERLLREKKYDSSYSFDVDLDEDIEGITSDLETRLGEYTRSILSSVADSLKSSMGIAIKSAGNIGDELKIVGKDLSKIGKEIGEKVSKEVNVSFGTSSIPDDKLEEFYEIGALIVSAIGDSNRLRILKELEKGPMYQKELSDITNLRGGTFKHHMDKLIEDEVKFVTQEVVRGRYLLTTRGREALKLAEIQFMRYLDEKAQGKSRNDSDEEYNVKIK
ncbi:MAG: winged helix-turn-helix transcriptional regulator [Candidatus Heimdallarchaeota archaeon]|nr:winged helix-turn-helix transcriptional regulator [Candidatus Heimdallarchaeota archaeon]